MLLNWGLGSAISAARGRTGTQDNVRTVRIGHFGAETLELQALDDGSGRLVRFYERLGLAIVRQADREMVWMESHKGERR